MTVLDHKAWHELGRMRGQSVAVAVLVACATAAWVSTALTERAMLRTRDAYYERQRFADVFVSLRRAPDAVATRLAAIPGVAAVETRVVWAGRLQLPDGRAARATFVSLPDAGSPLLNRLVIRSGRDLLPFERGAALLTEGFARANHLSAGGYVDAIVNGRRERLRVAGIALSPEYVYAIGPGMIFPDDRGFGVVWMARADLGPAAGLDGAFNAAALQVGARADQRRVLAAVDEVLAPWGGTGAYPRADQLSHRYLSDEILQLRAIAVVVPGIFLAITAFLLSVIVTRLVQAQRQQIGMLKALGYSDATIGAHYVKLVGAVVLAGDVAGALAGVALGSVLAQMYAQFYRFPFLLYADAPSVIAAGFALSLAAALAGVARAVSRAVRLPPAEAMRPEVPAAFHLSRIDSLAAARALAPAWRMVLRNLARRPLRALSSSFGVAAGMAVIVVAGSLADSLQYLLRLQFERARREDAIVVFSEASGPDAIAELEGIDGVLAVEPYRHVAVTLRHGASARRVELAGLTQGSALWRLVDLDGHVVPVPPSGLVVSAQLGRILHAGRGDVVTAQVHEGRMAELQLPIVATVDDFVGVSATTSLDALDAALQEGRLASGALLWTEQGAAPAVAAKLAERPRVAGVTTAADALASMREVISRYMLGFVAVLGAFAVVLAAGVVYNAARVAFAERSRDLATLRVLGFTAEEAWRILAGELAVLVAVAVPLGWAFGRILVAAASRGLSSDLFRLPARVTPGTWSLAAVAVVGVATVLVIVARRWVSRVDLVEVLKARE